MADNEWALDGAVEETDAGWRLIAGRCAACAKLTFPRPKVCSACWSEAIEPAHLSTEGELYTFAVVHASRPGWRTPYMLGYVDLPEGVRVCAPIDAAANQPAAIGARVRLVAGVLRTNPDGGPVLSHRFEMM